MCRVSARLFSASGGKPPLSIRKSCKNAVGDKRLTPSLGDLVLCLAKAVKGETLVRGNVVAHHKLGAIITFKLRLEKYPVAEQITPSITIERINIIFVDHEITG